MTAAPDERPPASLRERKKEKTRVKLVQVATRLFLDEGFEETTVGAIAAAAEVSPRTFFRYFPTKEAVVFRHHPARLAQFRALLAEHRKPARPFEGVRLALLAFARTFEKAHVELLAEWRIVTASPLLIARDVELDTEFEAAIAESVVGAGDPGAPIASHQARLFAGALFGVIRAVMQEWYAGGCEVSLVALGEEGLRMAGEGFARFGTARAAPPAPESARRVAGKGPRSGAGGGARDLS
jgi:AcrR family transcriptional regulator